MGQPEGGVQCAAAVAFDASIHHDFPLGGKRFYSVALPINFADYLAALWEGRERESDHYDRLYQLERRLRAGEREVVLADCQQERESHPECAATCYLLSLAEQDIGQAARWQTHRDLALRQFEG